MATCFSVEQAGFSLKKQHFEITDCAPLDVIIDISHCGVCHSDIDLIDNNWGFSHFPLVAGHEIVGHISSLGRDVVGLEIGQRVGIGWQRNACFQCDSCINGDVNLCQSLEATCINNIGGFSDSIKIDSRFVFPIPDTISSAEAAPLFCAGITAYSAFRNFGLSPQMNVGVLGVGGIGHLAVQYGRAFGCHVTAMSSSLHKKEEILDLGAHRFFYTNDKTAFQDNRNSFDFILSTVSVNVELERYIELLKPKGTLCIVGFIDSPLEIPTHLLIAGQKSICGNPIGSASMIKEMLHFSARHNITAKVDILPMEDINLGLDITRRGKAKYRIVLENTR